MNRKLAQNKKKIRYYSDDDLATIHKKAHEIWEKKCNSFNKALNDWLEAESETRKKLRIDNKKSCEYTDAERGQITTKAQALHKERIQLLNSALDDWLEAEKAVEAKLKMKLDARSLFCLWYGRMVDACSLLRKKEIAESIAQSSTVFPGGAYDNLGQHYITMMSDLMN